MAVQPRISERTTKRPYRERTRPPLVRLLDWFEDRGICVAAGCVSYRAAAELRRLHDVEHDRLLLAALRCIDAGDGIGARVAILDAMRADEREDAAADAGDGHVLSVHELGKQIAREASGLLKRLARRGGEARP